MLSTERGLYLFYNLLLFKKISSRKGLIKLKNNFKLCLKIVEDAKLIKYNSINLFKYVLFASLSFIIFSYTSNTCSTCFDPLKSPSTKYLRLFYLFAVFSVLFCSGVVCSILAYAFVRRVHC